MIAAKAGLAISRIKDIREWKVNPAAQEPYLIKITSSLKSSKLFNILFKEMQSNSLEEEAQLRMLEE